MRWLVERAHGTDNFEDVGADEVVVVDGCLVFRERYQTNPTVIIAAGQWKTVVEAAE
jgi:hypothetical protein